MRHREQALLLLKKAADDEALLQEVIESRQVSDEIFGFHCQQAVEKLLKALLSDFSSISPEPTTCVCSWIFSRIQAFYCWKLSPISIF